MQDHPEYDLAEFLLAGLFIAAAGSAFVWSMAGVWFTNAPQAAEGAGLCFMFLGGAVHPKKFVVDVATFPFTFMATNGRETPVTVLAAWLGAILWLAALLYSHVA